MPANRRVLGWAAVLFLAFCSAPAQTGPDPAEPSSPASTWQAASSGVLRELVMGDVACYLSLDAGGEPFTARGTFETCDQLNLVGTSVQWTYIRASVLADSCVGDPECPDTEPAFLVDDLRAGHAEPFFRGPVGHLEAAGPFLTFTEHHAGRTAHLELSWNGEVMLEHPEDGAPFFVLWNDCDPPESPGEAVGAHRCGGVEIQLGDGAFELDDAHLAGIFKIGELVGPHQGLFALPLEAVEPRVPKGAVDYAGLFGVPALPSSEPLEWKAELVEAGTLHHAGVFSPDLRSYYFTVSDAQFRRFDVKVIERTDDGWSEPRDAFFSSEHNEHGVAFSTDGRRLYFSSTRPVPGANLPETWRLWTTSLGPDGWSEPTFVDIPGLRSSLVSHPSVTADGTLYFHAGEPDYSELRLYRADVSDGTPQQAELLPAEINGPGLNVTPYVTPDESFLIFERAPDLWIAHRGPDGKWQQAVPLPDAINQNGKGNPYLTPDRRYLFFAAGPDPQPETPARWSIYWVDTESFLEP